MSTTTTFSATIFKGHACALDALYALIKAQHIELARLTCVIRPARLPHPFVNSPVRGDDLLAANLVLWTAMSMASGIAGALNADCAQRLYQDTPPIRAIFGDGYDATSFVSRDMLLARLQLIHEAIN